MHIFHKSKGVVYRTTDGVPTFSWNWLGSILHPANKDATDHQKKEEYAFRFMLLFVPFRSREDLEPDGGFYQNALQKAQEDGRITNDMIEIAEIIQTIHNSLASRLPENSLSAETKLTETVALENANGDDDDDDDDYEDLLASIGFISHLEEWGWAQRGLRMFQYSVREQGNDNDFAINY
jgi:hypothetical protein